MKSKYGENKDIYNSALKAINEREIRRIKEIARFKTQSKKENKDWKTIALKKMDKEKVLIEKMFDNVSIALKEDTPAEVITKFLEIEKGVSGIKAGLKIILPSILNSPYLKRFKISVEQDYSRKKVLLIKENFFISLPTTKHEILIYGNIEKVNKPYLKKTPEKTQRRITNDRMKLSMFLEGEISLKEIQKTLKKYSNKNSIKNAIFGFNSLESRKLAKNILSTILVKTQEEMKFIEEMKEYEEYVKKQNEFLKEIQEVIQIYSDVRIKYAALNLIENDEILDINETFFL